MSAKTKRKIAAARRVRDKLKAEGRHFDAQGVDDLCRAHAMASKTLSDLMGDNMALRAHIVTLEAEVTRRGGMVPRHPGKLLGAGK